jgi:hypothetical protein
MNKNKSEVEGGLGFPGIVLKRLGKPERHERRCIRD